MSFIAAGIAGAGLAAQLGGSLLSKSPSRVFDYRAAEGELHRLREQIAKRDEYDRLEAEERARERGLADTERGRQKGFNDEINVSLGNEINRFDNVPGRVDATAKRLSDYFAANSGGMPNVMPAAQSGPTAAYAADQSAKAAAFNTQQNNATAKVRSFGDLWSDIGNESLRDKTHMTNLTDFKQGSRALLAPEMRPIVNRQPPQISAGQFGDMYSMSQPDNTFADILKGAGSVAMSYGLSGFSPFGSSTTGAGGGWSTGFNGYGPTGGPRYGGPR